RRSTAGEENAADGASGLAAAGPASESSGSSLGLAPPGRCRWKQCPPSTGPPASWPPLSGESGPSATPSPRATRRNRPPALRRRGRLGAPTAQGWAARGRRSRSASGLARAAGPHVDIPLLLDLHFFLADIARDVLRIPDHPLAHLHLLGDHRVLAHA